MKGFKGSSLKASGLTGLGLEDLVWGLAEV